MLFGPEQLRTKVAQLAQENAHLLQLLGGTTPTTTLPIPTVIFQGHAIKANLADYLVLAGACVLMLLLWALPLVKPIRGCIESRIYKIYPAITLLNFIILATTLSTLNFVAFNDLFFDCVKAIEIAIDSVSKILMAFVGLLVLVFGWKFKDRLLEAIGVDNPEMVVGEFRDWATCWSMKRFYPIEVFIWKVEGLPGLHLHQFNDVFVEASCGYNNTMRTRVHEKAGHNCIIKESMQLNFDHLDNDSRFHITVKNQDVMGSTDIAEIVLSASKVYSLLEKGSHGPEDASKRTIGWGASAIGENSAWQASSFKCIDLIPAGQVFIRFQPIDDEELSMRTSYGKTGGGHLSC